MGHNYGCPLIKTARIRTPRISPREQKLYKPELLGSENSSSGSRKRKKTWKAEFETYTPQQVVLPDISDFDSSGAQISSNLKNMYVGDYANFAHSLLWFR